MHKVKKILIAILIVSIICIGAYIALSISIKNGKITEESFWFGFKSWVGFIGLVSIIVVGIVYIVTNFSKWRSKGNDKPIDIVGSDKAQNIVFEQFILNTHIPYYINNTDKKKEMKVVHPSKTYIRDGESYNYKTTGVPMRDFEVFSTEGIMQGLTSFSIRLDKGEKWIKENWNNVIKRNTPLSLLKESKERPRSTPQDEEMRYRMMEWEGREEGTLSRQEIRALQDIASIPRKPTEESLELPDPHQNIHSIKEIQKATK